MSPVKNVFVYPELNKGLLKQGKVVDGSTFYLLRTWNLFNGKSSERMAIEDAVALLCEKGSKFKRFSEHYFRYVVLPRGNGLFWGLSKTHIYFRSIAKVSVALDCGISAVYVEVPAKNLLKNKVARATLYASIEDAINRGSNKPISRAKLAEVTGVPRSTQKTYDIDLNRQRIRNFGVVGIEFNAHNAELVRQTITQDDRPLFAYTDKNDMYEKGKQFVAYEIPSSRLMLYKVRRDNHISRIRKEHKAHEKGTGNPCTLPRLYFGKHLEEHKKKAVKAYNKDPRELLWFHESRLEPTASTKTRLQGVQYWGVMR